MLTTEDVFNQGPVIPILIIRDLAQVLPLMEALQSGGFSIVEITLRTHCALEAIKMVRKNFPEICVGAGTILNSSQFQQVAEVGAQFAISPGLTPCLLVAGKNSGLPFIPGISTVSELMLGMETGYQHFKLFPAQATGGIAFLKSLVSPFPEISFCPTGGLSETNYLDYLSLPNVKCVGGSWMIPEQALMHSDWHLIKQLSSRCQNLAPN